MFPDSVRREMLKAPRRIMAYAADDSASVRPNHEPSAAVSNAGQPVCRRSRNPRNRTAAPDLNHSASLVCDPRGELVTWQPTESGTQSVRGSDLGTERALIQCPGEGSCSSGVSLVSREKHHAARFFAPAQRSAIQDDALPLDYGRNRGQHPHRVRVENRLAAIAVVLSPRGEGSCRPVSAVTSCGGG